MSFRRTPVFLFAITAACSADDGSAGRGTPEVTGVPAQGTVTDKAELTTVGGTAEMQATMDSPMGVDTGTGSGNPASTVQATDAQPSDGTGGQTDALTSKDDATASESPASNEVAVSSEVPTDTTVPTVTTTSTTTTIQEPASTEASPVLDEDDVLLDAVIPEPVETDDEDCDSSLEVVYRDFDNSHPDFEGEFGGDDVRLGLMETVLGTDGKPVFRNGVGIPPKPDDRNVPREPPDWMPTSVTITSAESFSSWYNTVDGVNIEFNKILELTETAEESGVYVFDSTAFFPLGPDEGYGEFQSGKNFLFTSEIHLLFTYVSGQVFSFRGDDDLWIYVNNTLALDRGSMHRADQGEGTIDFDAQAEVLGITAGGLYSMDVFHAERRTSESNFRIETNIGCFKPAPPRIR